MNQDNPFQPNDAFEDDLKAYLDGELPLLRRFQVGRHLSRCAACQQELEIMQTLSQELEKSDATSPLDADLRAKILSQAPNETPPIVVEKAPKRRLRLGLDYLVIAGTLCLVGITVLSVMGSKVGNAFNKAANALGDDSGSSADERASVGAGAPAASSPADDANQWRTANRSELRPLPGFSNGADYYRKAVPPQRAVHKEGSISVSVDDAEAKSEMVELIVKNVGGFVANNALETGAGGQKTATLDVRIPVAQFESITAKIGKLGKVKGKSIKGEDITQQVTRVGAHQQSLQNELSIREAQLRAAKKEAARRNIVADVRQLRMQANQARAELEYLKKYAALSTLFVTLQDKPAPVTPAGWTQSLGQTGGDAWKSFLTTAKVPLQILIWVLAYAPLWLPALIIWRKWGRKLLEI